MGPSLKCSLQYCPSRKKGVLLPKIPQNELFALKVWWNFDQKAKGKNASSCEYLNLQSLGCWTDALDHSAIVLITIYNVLFINNWFNFMYLVMIERNSEFFRFLWGTPFLMKKMKTNMNLVFLTIILIDLSVLN